MHLSICAALAALLFTAVNAAALSPSDKCESGKLKEAGKYGFCRLKAEARAVKKGGAPDYSKCDAKYAEKWTGLEGDAGGECPSNGDEGDIQAFIAQHTDDLAVALDGGPLPNCPTDLATCDSNLDACLDAPQGQLLRTGQSTCYDAAGGVISCLGTGQDGELQKGLPRELHRQRRRHDHRQPHRPDVGEAERRRQHPRQGRRVHVGERVHARSRR